MKTEKSLEIKLEEAELMLPGVKEQLKPYKGATWGMHWNGAPEDVGCIETDQYKIVAAKWEEHNWSEDGGGIQWEEWLSLHYRKKESEGEIKPLKTEKIVTRDQYDAHRDRRDLWPYNFVGIRILGPDLVEIAWVNGDGQKGPTYELNLD